MSARLCVFAGFVAAAALGCSAPDASTLTHPPRKDSFPLYVTVPGSAPASGGLYRIDAPTALDAPTVPVLLLGGLEFPAAVAVSRRGEIFFSERPSASNGRISRLVVGSLVPEVVASGLKDPQGLAIDRTGRLYVTEAGAARISLVNADGTLDQIVDGLSGPRAAAADDNDNLLVAETGAGTVSKVIPDGTRSELATGLRNPVAIGPGLVGALFYLVNNSGMGDGRVVKLDKSGVTEEVYLDNLINPRSQAWEDQTILYVAEGAPAFRIIKYSRVSNVVNELASLPGDPHTIAFTPLN